MIFNVWSIIFSSSGSECCRHTASSECGVTLHLKEQAVVWRWGEKILWQFRECSFILVLIKQWMVENKMYLISEPVFCYTSERTSLYFRLRYEYKLKLLLQCQVWHVWLYYKIQSYPPWHSFLPLLVGSLLHPALPQLYHLRLCCQKLFTLAAIFLILGMKRAAVWNMKHVGWG